MAQGSSTNSNSDFQPFVVKDQNVAEFTTKAIVAGIIFGILFGAANAYLGLLVGLTVSTSIPVAVMTVGFFRLTRKFFGRATILESNISQTAGSASSSLASGVIFTIPALFLWGMDPTIFQMAMLAMLGGLLGILFMIPLRRFLIKQEHGKLPYPEGTACAQVLVAAESGGAKSGNVFLGLGVGIVYKLILELVKLWPDKLYLNLPFIDKAQLGMRATPAMLAIGYILGPRIATIMVSGSAISWLILIPIINAIGENLTAPWFPEVTTPIADMTVSQIWSQYIRYLGAGAVAFAGIITIIRSFPMMISSFKLTMEEMQSRIGNAVGIKPKTDRTDHDLPLKVVFIGAALIVLTLILVPVILGDATSISMRLLAAPAIAIFAFFFVTVSSRIVGLVGVSSNPTSGMTIVTLMGVSFLFIAMGWTDSLGKATALVVGTVVCVAASIAGDTSQDLKTGFIVGATPFKQQIAELIGAATSAFAVCASVVILNDSYVFGSPDLPAPQATLMKTILEGLLETGIPWGLVLAGVVLGAAIELFRLPSLPFAVGLYLPITTMTPIFVGGLVRWFLDRRHRDNKEELAARRERGILFSSGLIGGEGLLMVVVALYASFKGKPEGFGIGIPSPFGEIVSLAAFLLVGYYLYHRTRKD